VPYVVLDRDHSEASQHLLARFDGSGVFRRVANLSDTKALKQLIDERRAVVAIVIDADFARRLQSGGQAPIEVIADGRNSNTANTAVGYVNTVVQAFNADWRKAHGAAAMPLNVITRVWYNPNLETRWNFIPSLIGTLTLLQTLLLTTMSVAREREQGTFDQLLVTPFRPGEIMIGKALPSVFIGTAQATTILAVAQLWFRIPFAGSYLTLYAGLLLFLLAAVGIGLLLSSVAATMQQCMLYTFVLMMPFMLLSGLTTPIANMPVAVQYFTRINPLRYAIDISQRVYLEGVGLDQLGYDLWPLLVISLLTLPLAAWLFRRRLT
jgi:ABC-2 type transport system permease protein